MVVQAIPYILLCWSNVLPESFFAWFCEKILGSLSPNSSMGIIRLFEWICNHYCTRVGIFWTENAVWYSGGNRFCRFRMRSIGKIRCCLRNAWTVTKKAPAVTLASAFCHFDMSALNDSSVCCLHTFSLLRLGTAVRVFLPGIQNLHKFLTGNGLAL